jgi:hypothetical protein
VQCGLARFSTGNPAVRSCTRVCEEIAATRAIVAEIGVFTTDEFAPADPYGSSTKTVELD